MKFTELKLNDNIARGIADAAFIDCTAVQEMTLEKTLKGIDVYVQSQTGSGKTAAFLITIFNLFLEGKCKNNKALIIVPTRELAVQVENDARLLGKHCNFKIGAFFGGMGYVTQEKILKKDPNIYIGTPGRLIDFSKLQKIDFSKFDIAVIDEADRMFDMGFIPDIRYMMKKMGLPSQRLTMLFSATLNSRVKQLAWEYMNEPVEIEIEPEQLTVDTITQDIYHIGSDQKFNLLLGVLKKENPRSALIFCNTKRMAEIVSDRLKGNGYKNEYISGDLPQKKRLQIIEAIKSGDTEFLVATDVAARGLHIEDLDLVINYDLPDDCQNYVHRIGRTARAGKSGKAISLACERYVYNLEAIEKLIGMKINTIWPEDELLLQDKSKGLRHRQVKERDKMPRHARKGTAGAGAKRTERKENRKPARSSEFSESKKHARPETGAPKRKPEVRRPKEAPLQLKKDANLEDRIEYYKKKYGENFVVNPSEGERKVHSGAKAGKKPEKKKAGILKKVFSIIRRKKS